MIIKSPLEAFKSFTEGSPLKLVHGDPVQVKGFVVAAAMIAGMSGMAMTNDAQANPLGVTTQYSQPGEAPQFLKDAGASIKSGASAVSDKVSGTVKDMRDSQKGGYDPKAEESKTTTSSTADKVKDVAVTAVGVSVGAPLVAVGKGLQWMVNKAKAADMEKKPEPATPAPKW